MIDEREKDVQYLCQQVIENMARYESNPNGPDEYRCNFCFADTHRGPLDPSAITHAKDCAYLVAKDLSAGITVAEVQG